MPGVGGAVRKLRWSLAQRGLAGTVRFAFGRLSSKDDGKPKIHPFDVQHGTDTSGLIGGADLLTGHAHDVYNTAYYGMSPSRFRGAMELWQKTLSGRRVEEFTFVDLGCGKGRAVLMAMGLPFREVIGVELHPELARVAEANLVQWRSTGKPERPARIVCGDATEFKFPAGPCLLYLFNPFARPVVERLLRRLEVSFGDRAGLLDVVYFNPESAEAFAESGGFELLWKGTVELSAEDAAADLVASPDDQCELYRWMGSSSSRPE